MSSNTDRLNSLCHLFSRVFLRDFLPCWSLYMIDLECVKSHWHYYWKNRCRKEKIRREKFPSVKIVQCNESCVNEIKWEENLFIFLKKKTFLEVIENLWKRSTFLKNKWVILLILGFLLCWRNQGTLQKMLASTLRHVSRCASMTAHLTITGLQTKSCLWFLRNWLTQDKLKVTTYCFIEISISLFSMI